MNNEGSIINVQVDCKSNIHRYF